MFGRLDGKWGRVSKRPMMPFLLLLLINPLVHFKISNYIKYFGGKTQKCQEIHISYKEL